MTITVAGAFNTKAMEESFYMISTIIRHPWSAGKTYRRTISRIRDQILYISPRSKLSIRSLQGLLFIRRLRLDHLLVASPVHSLQTLRQDRMRVVEARVEPIGIHTRQVLDLQLDQRGTELARVAKLDGKSIYTVTLVLIL
jgi:hypothetical protein